MKKMREFFYEIKVKIWSAWNYNNILYKMKMMLDKDFFDGF